MAGTSEVVDPRVVRSKAAVLDAAVALFAEEGCGGCTVEGVSERSGVAKTTIYRHWPNRNELLLDVFDRLIEKPEPPDTGDVRSDLLELVGRFGAALADSQWSRVLPSLLEAAERDPDLADLTREFSHERRDPIRTILRRGVERGDLVASTDVDLAAVMLTGPMVYWRYLARRPVGPTRVADLVDAVLAPIRA